MTTSEGFDYNFSRYLVIDSRDRGFNKQTTVYNYQANKFFLNTISTVSGIKFIGFNAAEFDYATPNINTLNQSYSINGITYTIPVGYYTTMTAFITAFQATLPAGFTLTQDTITLRLTLAGGAPFTFKSESQNVFALLDQIGITQLGAVLSGSASYTGTSLPRLHYTRYINVLSRNLRKHAQPTELSNHRSGSLLFRFPIASFDIDVYVRKYISMSIKETIPIKWHFNQSETLGLIDIELQDEYGFLCPFEGDFNFSLHLYRNLETFEKNTSTFQ